MSAEKVTPADLEEELAALSREHPKLAQTRAQALAARQCNSSFDCKIFWEGICCAKHIRVSDGEVTVECHTLEGKADDTNPGPGIVVRWPKFGRRRVTITCERSLIENALKDFYAGKLKLGDVPESFVQEVLEDCSDSLRQ